MSALTQKPSLIASAILDNMNIQVTENPNAKKSANEQIIAFAGTSSGVFRFFQVLERVTKLVVEALKWTGSSLVGVYENLAGKFLVAWTSTSVLRLPDVTTRAIKAIKDFNRADQASSGFSRKVVKAVHDVNEMASMYFYSAAFFLGSISSKLAGAAKTVGDVPDLISNSTELQMNAEDWHLASHAAKTASAQNSPAEVEKAIVHTQRSAIIKVAKAACSVASGVLGMAALLYGVALLPAVVLTTISLTSTVLAIASHFYQESAPYKMIDFFQSRTIQVAPSIAI